MDLYPRFLEAFQYEPTPCQDGLFRTLSDFLNSRDGDILVVNGYAGSGKTSAISSAISALTALHANCVLLAPTGRSAKVFASYAGFPAYTIHKYIYRQITSGFGRFTLAPNKAKNTVFFVDEVSLVGIDSPTKADGEAVFGSGNLLKDLVEFVRNGTDCRLVMIGDNAQLPPVGLDKSPALDADLMNSFVGGVKFFTLKTVVRQAHDSGILHNATILREAITSYTEPVPVKLNLKGFDDIVRIDGSELIDMLTDSYSDYGQEGTVVLTRSNKRAIRYNLGIRSRVMYAEDRLLRGDFLMIVKNNYLFAEREAKKDPSFKLTFIANGDIARLERVRNFEERYGLEFADATLTFPDYDDLRMENVKVILDALVSESPSLSPEQQNALFEGVQEDYADIKVKKERYKAMQNDPYFNALQIKYASAITAHKSQGGGWGCVYIDYSFYEAAKRDGGSGAP
ncbi:MAG: AAA family ATPase, partial [Bacteroidales bacterium]|nr:AAA family ATPase [Bacteroidales bacterium]